MCRRRHGLTATAGWKGLLISPLLGMLALATANAQSNPVVIENQQPGTSAWDLDTTNVANDTVGQIKGYASAVSVNKGENITFNVTVNPPQTYTIDVYRIGWYQGLGGRLMQHIGPLNGATQPTCPMDAVTGMIECNWAPGYTLTTQTTWTSGVYLAVLINAQGFKNYIIFVVRDDGRVAPLVYQQPVTTYQAYNNYPDNGSTGKSLYDFNSYGVKLAATGYKSAAKVSFDRPYSDSGIDEGFRSDYGEVNFIRWIERNGYDVTYSTDVDTHADPTRLLNYRGFLSVGHDEYWSKGMYDAVVNARDAGVNVGFFGANAVFWQIRFENSSFGVPNRVVVCYKDATLDPNTTQNLKTVNWRDPVLNRPEQTLIGVQYNDVSGPRQDNQGFFPSYVVTNSTNWAYANSGFVDGNSVRGLVGYEADFYENTYPGPNAVTGTWALLSHSPWGTGPSDYSNSSIYQAPSGAWVFATGAMSYNWALDDYGHGYNIVNAGIQQLTKNVLDRFVVNAQSDYNIAASPTTQTLAPGGGSTTYTITITPKGGFNGTVALSISGLPTGATGTFSPNPTATTSTLTVTTDATTPTGTYTFTITGLGLGMTRTTIATLAVLPPDFTLSASPANQYVVPGTSTTYGVTLAPLSGFNGQVSLSVSGLPSGAGASFSPNPAFPTSTLTVTTSASTPLGTYTLTVSGVAAGQTHTATVTLSVVTQLPPPVVVAFDAVGPGPAGISTTSGSSLTWNHTVTTTGTNVLLVAAVAVGKSPDTGVSLALTYNGVQMTSAGIVHSNSRTDGFVQMFYLVAPAPGAHNVVATLTGGTASLEAGSISFTGVDQTTPIRNVTTNAGAGATPTVSVTSALGNMVVDAMVTGCNGTMTSNQTLRWINQVNCGTAGGNGAQSTAAGASSVTMGYVVPSDYWGMIGMDVVALGTVQPGQFDFSLTNQGNKSVGQGSSVTNTITANLSSGASQPASFSASGLPAGVTATFDKTTCSPTCAPVLTLTAASTAAPGTSTITVTAVAGSVTHATTFTLTVVAPDFAISATPASRTVAVGGSTTYTATITASGGFAGSVSLSVTGLPANTTGSFSTNPAPASSTLTVTTSAGTIPGTYPLTVTGVSGTLTHSTTVSLVVSAGIVVTAPNTAVSWKATSTQNITFTHTLGIGQVVNVDVSRDSGATWTPVTSFTTTNATSGTIPWVVTGPPTTHARIRVSLASNTVVSDMSDVDFTVTNPTITVTAPNTAVTWRAGDTKNITFSHTLAVGQQVYIDASGDGGTTWSRITTFTTTSATSGTYAWVVSGAPTTQARVRVTWTGDPTVSGMSAVNFTIQARTTVTAPNTAVTWGAGSTRQVTWSHNLGVGGLVDIDVSADNGVSWTPLAHGVASTAATTGTWTGPMPATVTTQARVRINPSSDPISSDISDVAFTLAAPTITVTAPNTAASWGIGSTQNIKWSHNLGTLDSVRIELARDGVNFTETIAASAPNTAATTGTYAWVVTGPAATTAKIRVTWLANAAVSDTSDVAFKVK